MTLGKLPWIDDAGLWHACQWAQKLMQGNEQYPAKGIDDACVMAARKYSVEPAEVKAIVETTVPGIRPDAPQAREEGSQRVTPASLDRKLDRIIGMLEKAQGSAPEQGLSPSYDEDLPF